ncbi:hypoxanthine-guanine phosphoribosyltransferase [Thiohalobacter sp. IOR34]|uniref:hypoxanthine-guanine phosphoribosyltransferase n=1 Tax=Thiohalobacter sp. IOR34 TaxID=3057176 RepID=UPI0025B034BE|nr:hypoxanthine-guanine phosphoribosyltransferase [Thiohalobacter sp. IOR34]WJW76757.1 hypoxanthine-guanine phosphoribosyltransferase [Thiohalobacter sp. IOR34]
MSITAAEAQKVYLESDQLYSPAEIEATLDRLAGEISARLAGSNPIVLSVMTGGLVFAGRLLPRLQFPLQLDYLHATRYRGGTRGGELHWFCRPTLPLSGRTLLILDDILDEGLTLEAILDDCRRAGAAAVYSAVLVRKCHDRCADHVCADFVGLEVEDRYVFGCGMDYHDYHRNLPGIHAVKAG